MRLTPYRVPLALLFGALLLCCTSNAHAQVAEAGSPLAELVRPDGTIDLSQNTSGAVDATGFHLHTTPEGAPVFLPEGSSLLAMQDVPLQNQGTINSLLVVNGQLYVGGLFSRAGEVAANNIARWDGTAWHPLGAGVNNSVRAIAMIGTDLYAGGSFTTADGKTVNRIARWDGTTWHALGTGTEGNVNVFAVIGTDLYVGGAFTTAGGVIVNGIARWNGTSWNALGSGLNGAVNALAVMGTDLYVGGGFTTSADASPTLLSYIARWNSSDNTWSAVGSGTSSTVNALAVMGTDLYVGGSFTTAGGVTVNRIARWNGTAWAALGASTVGVNSTVSALAVIGTDLYVGGQLTNAGGTPANFIARWNGTTWEAMGTGTNSSVNAVVANGSTLIVGGVFTTAGGLEVPALARWSEGAWKPAEDDHLHGVYSIGAAVTVGALATVSNGIVVGGSFLYAGTKRVNRIARWDGTTWHALGGGLAGTGTVSVNALAVMGDNVYAGGTFTLAGSPAITVNRVALWDGTNWHALGAGVDNTVNVLAVMGDNLYAGGTFTTAGSPAITVNRVALWDGSNWHALGAGVNSTVNALAVMGDNLYVGGQFTTAGSPAITVNRVTLWDGSNWHALGAGVNSTVNALAVMENNLYAGGTFTSAGGTAGINRVAKWTPATSTWSLLGVGAGNGVDNTVRTLIVHGTDLYVGGDFTSAGGTAGINRVARWNGSVWSNVGTGVANNVVNALALSNGDLYVGGTFTVAGGNAADYLLRFRNAQYRPVTLPTLTLSSSGFRLLSAPRSGTILSEFLSPIWTQGMSAGGDTTSGSPNVWTFDDTRNPAPGAAADWVPVTNLNTQTLAAGQGFLAYVYPQTNYSTNVGTLPVTLRTPSTAGTLNVADATFTDIPDGQWVLAGNPYPVSLRWDSFTRSNLGPVYVYDHSYTTGQTGGSDGPATPVGGWRTWNGAAGSLTDGLITPFQGFFIQASGGTGALTMSRAHEAASTGTFYKNDALTGALSLSLQTRTGSGALLIDEAFLSFTPEGLAGSDPTDAYKLMPFSVEERPLLALEGESETWSIANLPWSADQGVTLPLQAMHLHADRTRGNVPVEAEATLRWNATALPDHVEVALYDRRTGQSTTLSGIGERLLTTAAGEAIDRSAGGMAYPVRADASLELRVRYEGTVTSTTADASVDALWLAPVYPNPALGPVQVAFRLPEASLVRLQVYDVLGREVATLLNETRASGTHSQTLNVHALPAGVYVLRLQAGTHPITRTFTVAR